MSTCVGLLAGMVEGFRTRERKSRHGRDCRVNGFMVTRRLVIVWIGMVIVNIELASEPASQPASQVKRSEEKKRKEKRRE